MKKFITILLATGAALSAASVADAAQGCGPGGHRGPYDHCRPNRGPRGDVLVVDRFYQGRGYWDGHRYWQNRERWHNHWRYR